MDRHSSFNSGDSKFLTRRNPTGIVRIGHFLRDRIMQFLMQDYASWGLCSLLKPRPAPSQHLTQKHLGKTGSGEKRKTSPIFSRKKGNHMDFETHGRAWVKSLVWRLMGIVILGGISWIITHDWKDMTYITLLFHGIRMLLYYVHERLWNRIGWGRIRHPLSIFPVTRELEPQDQEKIRIHLRNLGYLD